MKDLESLSHIGEAYLCLLLIQMSSMVKLVNLYKLSLATHSNISIDSVEEIAYLLPNSAGNTLIIRQVRGMHASHRAICVREQLCFLILDLLINLIKKQSCFVKLVTS